MPSIHLSKIVPKGFAGITLWPFGIYVSNVKHLSNQRLIRHEKIHWEQQKELGGIFFYLLYMVEWLLKLFIHGKRSYYNLAAEREANKFENQESYLIYRNRYEWLKYIFIKQ